MRRSFAVMLAVALAAGLAPASGALPGSTGTAVPGTDPGLVTIYEGSYGVPHVVAGSQEAAAYGVGYVSGRDRLFQMDVIRRLAQGRLSEILGRGELAADITMRREFYDRADVDRQLAELPEHIRDLLQAYSDGVNAAMAEQTANPAELSVLFPALGYLPEPWTPHDSASVLLLFTMVSFAGTGEGGELDSARLLADLIAEHGDEQTALEVWHDVLLRNDPHAPAVIPHGEEPPGGAPFISADEPGEAQLELVRALHPDVLQAAAHAEAELHAIVDELLESLPVPQIGSYAIAATGERTASGKGLLLGAPQAGMFAPSIFYELGIHAPGIDCNGMTVPGLGPFIGIGWCNDHAWTLVAGNAGDQVDLYVVELCGDHAYRYEDDCVDMDRRDERYLVKSTPVATGAWEPEAVTETVWSTVHGPVFHLDEDAGYAFVFARSQAGHYLQTMEATYGLTSARSFADIEAAAERITASYNFVYADRGGNIAYRFTGWQPVRHPEVDHRLPVPGGGGFEWQSRSLPLERMPHVVNPESGYLVVNQGADSKPVSWWPRASGRFIGRWGRTRADQETMATRTGLDIESMKTLNRVIISDVDRVTAQLEHLVDGALADEDGRLGEAYALFDAWREAGYPRVDGNGDGSLDDPALAIFSADGLGFEDSPLWGRFINELWGSALGHAPRGSIVGRLGQTLAAIDDPGLFHHDLSVGWEEAFRDALEATLDDLEGRFGGAPMAEWRAPAPSISFSAIGLYAPPRAHVVDRGSYSLIVDLAAARGVSIQPPGNGRADRPGDLARFELTGEFPPHFADQVELYASFEFKPMAMAPADYLADAQGMRVLVYPGVP